MSYKNSNKQLKSLSMKYHRMYGALSVFCALCGGVASMALLLFDNCVPFFAPACFACFFWGLTGILVIKKRWAGLSLVRVKSFVEAIIGITLLGGGIFVTGLCIISSGEWCKFGLIIGLAMMAASIPPIIVGIATPIYYDTRSHLFK